MYRKRIGNVVFFPGVKELPTAGFDRPKTTLERNIRRLQCLRPAAVEVIERLVDDLLDELDRPAAGGAR